MAIGLTGCASGGSVGGFFDAPEEAPARTAGTAPVTFAAPIGAPNDVSERLTSQMSSAARQQNISVVGGDEAEFTVRGYLAASDEGNQAKVTYIWDVTDSDGERVHRISGEEVVSGGGDPWSGVDDRAIEKIAGETVRDLSGWLPRRQARRTARPAADRAAERRGERPSMQDRPTRTASIPRESQAESQAYVPAVSGAPGDGERSLTQALRQQLLKGGINLANTQSSGVHTVRGQVQMGEASEGQQSITIEWHVLDPDGQRLGTVSQKNTVEAGSLDGAWGGVADAAASAAAEGVLRLLRESQG